jgi:hypothetical protein
MRRLTFTLCNIFAAAIAVHAQPSPTAPANLDHFNCYLAVGHIMPQLAILQDQFDAAAGSKDLVRDLRMILFCNPVQKNYAGTTTPILHPADHLAMYVVPPEPLVPRSVTITNQFGTQQLITTRAEILAVPSGKTPIAATTVAQLPKIPPANELDHFKCYAASGAAINKTVQLTDQFFTTGYRTTLLQPLMFCNPVAKSVVSLEPSTNGGSPIVEVNTTQISNPQGHLTCYLQVPQKFSSVVMYNNQFVLPGTLPTQTLGDAEVLCVPSLKSENWTVITGASTNGGN